MGGKGVPFGMIFPLLDPLVGRFTQIGDLLVLPIIPMGCSLFSEALFSLPLFLQEGHFQGEGLLFCAQGRPEVQTALFAQQAACHIRKDDWSSCIRPMLL